jgi:plastocyanin
MPLLGYGFEQSEAEVTRPDTVSVKVLGTSSDSRFEPRIVHVSPGDVIRFDVKEGMHTVTAYHPDNRRELGIPEEAASFDSGILTAGQSWLLTITHTGEYNYFCMPHERLGHVGKIISDKTKLNNRTPILNN